MSEPTEHVFRVQWSPRKVRFYHSWTAVEKEMRNMYYGKPHPRIPQRIDIYQYEAQVDNKGQVL